MCWSAGLVEDILLSAVSSLSSPDHACDSYLLTTGHLVTARERAADGRAWSDSFVTILENLHLRCEQYLVNYVNHAIHCPGWSRLTQEMRDKIRAGKNQLFKVFCCCLCFCFVLFFFAFYALLFTLYSFLPSTFIFKLFILDNFPMDATPLTLFIQSQWVHVCKASL